MKRNFILAGLVICLGACHKQTTSSSGEIFPNQVGDHWVYKWTPDWSTVADSGSIVVDVVGEMSLADGEKAKIWANRYSNNPGYVDSTLVVSNDSLVEIFYYTGSNTPVEKRRYSLPLTVSYQRIYFNDTTTVLSQLEVQVPAGDFPGSFELAKTTGYSVNSWTRDTIFLTPHVGMTKFYQQEFSLGPFPGDGIWELASYRLVPPSR